MTVRYPQLRQQAFEIFEIIANSRNPDFWKNRKMGFWLTEYVNSLDTLGLLDEPESAAGEIIEDSEVEAIGRAGGLLISLVAGLGEAPDAVYLSDARWAQMESVAQTAVNVMLQHPDNGEFRLILSEY